MFHDMGLAQTGGTIDPGRLNSLPSDAHMASVPPSAYDYQPRHQQYSHNPCLSPHSQQQVIN